MISYDDPVHQQMLEMAYDANPQSRPRLLEMINALEPRERAEWNALLNDVDELRTMLSSAEISEEFSTRLMGIANQAEMASQDAIDAAKRKWTQSPIVRAAIAACLALGLGLVAWLNWPVSDDGRVPKLSSSLSGKIATTARAFDPESSKPEITTHDRAELLAALSKRELPFAPAVLDAGPEYELEGAAVVKFRDQPAVMTIWHHDKQKLLLFQFDPKPLSMPRIYLPEKVKRDETEVAIWPGANGACAWALVSNQPMDHNPFLDRY